MSARRFPRHVILAAPAILALAYALAPQTTAAQILRGRVLDETTAGGVAGAQVRLLDGPNVVASALTSAEGRFYLEAPRTGAFGLEVSALGYEPHGAELELSDPLRLLTLRITPQPIPLDELKATIRAHPMRHEATYAGFYARHRSSPSVGSNRVLMRTDPEFTAAASIRDLLVQFRPSRCAPFVFWNGFYRGRASGTAGGRYAPADDLLDVSVSQIEGIEYYRDGTTMPQGLRELLEAEILGVPLSLVRRCGVVAIWPRRRV